MMKKVIFCAFLLCAILTALCACGTAPASPEATAAVTTAVDVGEGQTAFAFTVVDAEGNRTSFTVHTDKSTVGEALVDAGLIAGEPGPYGLYVKSVNGVRADYDKDGCYWAFYIDGEMAMQGVDATEIAAGAAYMFKIEK